MDSDKVFARLPLVHSLLGLITSECKGQSPNHRDGSTPTKEGADYT